MVSIGFGGEELIQVNLSLDEVRKLLQEALEKRVLLELQVQNEHGEEETVIINPVQVKVLQNSASAELFAEVAGMTVGQLITQLSGRPEDAKVLVYNHGLDTVIPVRKLANDPGEVVLIPEVRT